MRTWLGLERFLAGCLVIWGVLLLIPTNTFANGHAYQAMADLAPEEVWGVVMLTLGCGQLLGFVLAHYGYRSDRLHRVALLAEAALFGFMAMMFATVDLTLFSPYLWAWAAVAALHQFWYQTSHP